jgi:hypothetical protein
VLVNATPTPRPVLRWEIFCRAIDNLGDIGVCWRLALALAEAGHHVRLWCDDLPTLGWMAPHTHPRVVRRDWPLQEPVPPLGDVVIEAFGCHLGPAVEAAVAQPTSRAPRQWLNLEYLTAEPFAARNHTLPSPVLSGPAAGMTKTFFYPGFTADTGGVLQRAPTIPAGDPQPPSQPYALVFCYEPLALGAWLDWAQHHGLAVYAAGARTQAACAATGRAHWRALPPMSQAGFDSWLLASTFNWVRGEDSLVGALLAGRPMLWQAYPQHDNAHHAKVLALLDWLQGPSDLHHAWQVVNHMATDTNPWLPTPNSSHWNAWQACIGVAQVRLLQQPPLHQQLLDWVYRQLESSEMARP